MLRRPVEPGQYAAHDYRNALAARGITVSMSRKGDCWENDVLAQAHVSAANVKARSAGRSHNAPMESANGTVKVECVHGVHFRTRAEAAQARVEYFGDYNTERLHSSLGYLAPSEFERRWRAENAQRATTAQ